MAAFLGPAGGQSNCVRCTGLNPAFTVGTAVPLFVVRGAADVKAVDPPGGGAEKGVLQGPKVEGRSVPVLPGARSAPAGSARHVKSRSGSPRTGLTASIQGINPPHDGQADASFSTSINAMLRGASCSLKCATRFSGWASGDDGSMPSSSIQPARPWTSWPCRSAMRGATRYVGIQNCNSWPQRWRMPSIMALSVVDIEILSPRLPNLGGMDSPGPA